MVSVQILTKKDVKDIFRARGTEVISGRYRSYYIWFIDSINQTSCKLRMLGDVPYNEFHIQVYDSPSTGLVDYMSTFVEWSEESQGFLIVSSSVPGIRGRHIPLSWGVRG